MSLLSGTAAGTNSTEEIKMSDSIATGINWVDALLNPTPVTPAQNALFEAFAAHDEAVRNETIARRAHMWNVRQYGYGRHTDTTGPVLLRACETTRAAAALVERLRPAATGE
jgi:hypothetical protein